MTEQASLSGGSYRDGSLNQRSWSDTSSLQPNRPFTVGAVCQEVLPCPPSHFRSPTEQPASDYGQESYARLIGDRPSPSLRRSSKTEQSFCSTRRARHNQELVALVRTGVLVTGLISSFRNPMLPPIARSDWLECHQQ